MNKYIKLSIFIFLFSLLLLFSCTDNPIIDSNPNDENNTITQVQLNTIIKPCVDQNDSIKLPIALLNPHNYNSNIYTLELHSAVTTNNAFLHIISNILSIPPNAIIYKPDNVTIFDGDIAYTWGTYPDKYVYKQSDDGYSIYKFTSKSLFSGRKIITMTQSESCDDFRYTVYASENDEDKKIGNTEFNYRYINVGTAIFMRYETNLYDNSNNSYWFRSFEDLSGELTRKNGNQVNLTMHWNQYGNGTYTEYKNGEQIAQGIYEF